MGVEPAWAQPSGCTQTAYVESQYGEKQLTFNPPVNYSPNTDTCWQIYAGRHEDKVDIKFTDMDLEESNDCKDNDYVEVRDGEHIWSVSEINACGSSLPGTFRSSEAFVLIHFVSDGDSSTGAGFALKYSSYDEVAARRAATRDTYVGIGIAAAVILVIAIGCGLHRKFRSKNRVVTPRDTTRGAPPPPAVVVPPTAAHGTEPQHYRGESRRSFSYAAPQFPVYGPGYQGYGGDHALFSMQPPPYSPRDSPPAYSLQIVENQDQMKEGKDQDPSEKKEETNEKGEADKQEIEDLEETELRY